MSKVRTNSIEGRTDSQHVELPVNVFKDDAVEQFADTDDSNKKKFRINDDALRLRVGSITVPSIGDLKDLDTSNYPNNYAINVLGYYAEGDGGGGTFYWDDDSVESDNGGTIIIPTAGGTGRWIRAVDVSITPEMFGAKGDGTTDDYVPLNTYLQLSHIYPCRTGVANKTYLISSTISLGGILDIDLRGRIKQANGANLDRMVRIDTSNYANVHINIDGNKDNNTTAVGVEFLNCKPQRLSKFEIGAEQCTKCVRILGNSEYFNVDAFVQDSEIGVEVDTFDSNTPDELKINITGHWCDTYFLTNATGGGVKSSGLVIFNCEATRSTTANCVIINSGYWTIGGELRGMKSGIAVGTAETSFSPYIIFDNFVIVGNYQASSPELGNYIAFKAFKSCKVVGTLWLSNFSAAIHYDEGDPAWDLTINSLTAFGSFFKGVVRLGDATADPKKEVRNVRLRASISSAGNIFYFSNIRDCYIEHISGSGNGGTLDEDGVTPIGTHYFDPAGHVSTDENTLVVRAGSMSSYRFYGVAPDTESTNCILIQGKVRSPLELTDHPTPIAGMIADGSYFDGGKVEYTRRGRWQRELQTIARGKATIPSGSVLVAVDLPGDITVSDLAMVTPTTLLGTATMYYVTIVGGSTPRLRIHIDQVAGADVKFNYIVFEE